MLPAHDPAVEVLAGELATLEIERIAVGVARRTAECSDPAVLPDVAVLRIAGHIAEHQVLTLARPGWTLRPLRTGPQPAHGAIARCELPERRIDDDDVGVGIDRGVARAPIARRGGNRARRRAELGIGGWARLRHHPARRQCCGASKPRRAENQ